MERYANGKEWDNHDDYYDDDNYVDENGAEL